MSHSKPPDELILFPSLKAQRAEGGSLVMTKKFLEGAEAFARDWPGPVKVLVEVDDRPTGDMDRVAVDDFEGDIEVEERPRDRAALEHRLQVAAAALAFLDGKAAGLADACAAAGVPLVCVSEYSPKTERQITKADVKNPLRRLRRTFWLWQEERRRRATLPRVAGIQCSGTPTFDLYRPINPNALLFFDNRVERDGILSEELLARKAADLRSGGPLRLVFGGRLAPMKGVADLPAVAKHLRDLGVDFRLTIVGSGPLSADLTKVVAAGGLEDLVELRPPVDFRTGWLPLLRMETDLFLCTHIQGDPSSTYPEVMSCGVPIVGYDNEAFSGVLAHSDGGWAVPLHRPERMAEAVARLDRNRDEIVEKAAKALSFARQHAFEDTFARRAAHLRDLSRLEGAPPR